MKIDLLAPGAFADGHPWDQYEWLRENSPVHRHPDPDGPDFWAVTRYDDVRSVSRQPLLFSSAERGVMLAEPDEMSLAAARQMMLTMDPPQHERFRRLVSRGFTPRQAHAMQERIKVLAAEIVSDVEPKGDGDLVSDIAGRLPSGLIAELMGVPRADGERLYQLTEIMHTTDPDAVTPEQQVGAITEMLAYAASVARDKLQHPADDIASNLVQSEIDGERLTEEEFQWFFLLLVNAGGDTTRNLVSAGMKLLFDHPDQRDRLVGDLDTLLPSAVEEMLRFTSPVVQFRRTCMEDTTIGEQPVSAGDKVVIWYGAANRDGTVFDSPDQFDVGRDPNPHVAFGGGGAHLCLGMHVARVEIAALLREILSRLDGIAPAGPAQRLASNFIAGYHSMPVRWNPIA